MKVWLSLIALIAVMGLLLFVSAGTAYYRQGWIFLGVYLGVSVLSILYALKRAPSLLARRMRGGPTAEKRTPQKITMFFTSIGFMGLLVVPGLDHRFGWSHVPLPVVIIGDLLIVAGWFIVLLVLRENRFASATIELAADQKVISTGPYAVVRHPMYAGSLVWLIGMPPALGSYWGWAVFAAMMPFLLWRLFDEERFLSENLPGYAEYCAQVSWRLIPRVF